MLGTLFFVHGTGVRGVGYERTIDSVRDGMRRVGLDGVTLTAPAWGPKLGVPIDRIPSTLPAAITKAALGGPAITEVDVEAARWSLLLDDPTFELRLVAESAPAPGGEVVIGGYLPEQVAVERLSGLKEWELELEGTGLSPREVALAADTIASSAELLAATRAVGSATDPDLAQIEARAVVASVLALHRLDELGTAPAAALKDSIRDDLVDRVAAALGPVGTKGVKTWILNKAATFAQRKATSLIADRRDSVMGMAAPALGDILFYQRRGQEIVKFVTEALAGAQPPIVAVGHSLGGIVLIDLLTRSVHPPVDLLVTVGSQAPLFFAIDALEKLRPGQVESLPPTPWINIYDRRDLLSFCAERIFEPVQGIDDHEVDSGVPFPASHSAYWLNERVFELLRDRWPAR